MAKFDSEFARSRLIWPLGRGTEESPLRPTPLFLTKVSLDRLSVTLFLPAYVESVSCTSCCCVPPYLNLRNPVRRLDLARLTNLRLASSSNFNSHHGEYPVRFSYIVDRICTLERSFRRVCPTFWPLGAPTTNFRHGGVNQLWYTSERPACRRREWKAVKHRERCIVNHPRRPMLV